jgi:actin-related protein
MFRRTRKEEIARLEAQEKERKLKEKKRAESIARQKALEEERLRKLEERARRKAQEGTVKSREAYQAAWARLVDPKRQQEQLRLEDFPWPISRESGGQLDADGVQSFLLAHLDVGDLTEQDLAKKRKQALRTAVLAYHPDRFERYVLRVQENQRTSVREMGRKLCMMLSSTKAYTTVQSGSAKFSISYSTACNAVPNKASVRISALWIDDWLLVPASEAVYSRSCKEL